jgi:hypothetical protein
MAVSCHKLKMPNGIAALAETGSFFAILPHGCGGYFGALEQTIDDR